MGIEHATPGAILFLVAIFYLFLKTLQKAKEGRTINVRRIAGIDAIEEAIGRSAELGRPTVFTTGLTGVGPVLYACLGVLHSVAARIARFKTKLFIAQSQPDAMAIVENVTREAYRQVGREQTFDPTQIIYLSDEQFAFAAGYMGLVHREKAAATFLFGTFAAESLIMAEAGQQVGAMQVAATVSPEQVAFFISTCDYTLIGEELFAASAYMSKEKVQLGTVRSQDLLKAFFFCVIVIGVCIATFNSAFPSHEIKNIDWLLRSGVRYWEWLGGESL